MRRRRFAVAGLIIVGGGLLVIQFFRPARNEGALSGTADISHSLAVPDTVAAILHGACYDCHSDRTGYPWYARVQPVGWWLASHIREGKRELNFSAFGGYAVMRQRSKLMDLAHSLEDGSMPLRSYRLMHAEARLSASQAQLVMAWARRAADSISMKQ